MIEENMRIKGRDVQITAQTEARTLNESDTNQRTNDRYYTRLVDKLFSESTPDFMRRKIICYIIEDYVKRYKPHSRTQIISYLTRKHKVPYNDARSILNALMDLGMVKECLL